MSACVDLGEDEEPEVLAGAGVGWEYGESGDRLSANAGVQPPIARSPAARRESPATYRLPVVFKRSSMD